MSTRHLDDLRAQAQHARQRYQLYKAKVYGPRATSWRACASSNAPTNRQKRVFAPQRHRSDALAQQTKAPPVRADTSVPRRRPSVAR
jgi:hypothetical protein